jgi:hypothetical protein
MTIRAAVPDDPRQRRPEAENAGLRDGEDHVTGIRMCGLIAGVGLLAAGSLEAQESPA